MNEMPPRLFEVNLLGDRISVLRRREVFRRVVGVATLSLLILGGFFASLAVSNISTANRFRNGIQALRIELAEEEMLCAEIDKLRDQANEEVTPLRALLPLAADRVSWAPKLRAIKENIQPGTGVQSVFATSGKAPKKAPPPEKASKNTKKPATPPAPPPVNPDDLPSLSIAFLYLPLSGSADPIAPVEALREDSIFMQGLSDFRMEATEEGYWKGQPVIILRAKAQGGLR